MVMVSLKFVWFLKWLIRVFCFFRTCLLVTSFLTMCLHQMCETLYDLPKGLRIWINQNCCGPKCHWHQSIKSCSLCHTNGFQDQFTLVVMVTAMCLPGGWPLNKYLIKYKDCQMVLFYYHNVNSVLQRL